MLTETPVLQIIINEEKDRIKWLAHDKITSSVNSLEPVYSTKE